MAAAGAGVADFLAAAALGAPRRAARSMRAPVAAPGCVGWSVADLGGGLVGGGVVTCVPLVCGARADPDCSARAVAARGLAGLEVSSVSGVSATASPVACGPATASPIANAAAPARMAYLVTKTPQEPMPSPGRKRSPACRCWEAQVSDPVGRIEGVGDETAD